MANELRNIGITKKSLLAKLTKTLFKLSEATFGLILTMYYSARDPQTPKWAKATIFVALAYFILPIDSIPDLLPNLGYTDDITVLSSAFAAVASQIKEEHKIKAQKTLSKVLRK